MTGPYVSSILQHLVGLAAGLGLGWIHLTSLRLNARMYLSGNTLLAIPFQLVRLGFVAAVLVASVRAGLWTLLATALGLVSVRMWSLRRFGDMS